MTINNTEILFAQIHSICHDYGLGDEVKALESQLARMREALVEIEAIADDGADYCTDKGPNGYMEILSVARGALK